MLDAIIYFPVDKNYGIESPASRTLNYAPWVESAHGLVRSLFYLREPAISAYKAAAEAEAILEKLPKEQNIHSVYMMISAYAIENLLKTIVIRDAELNINGEAARLPKEVKGHDLNKIANAAKVFITDAREDLLARLSHYSVWAGCCSAPMVICDLKSKFQAEGEKKYLQILQGSDIRGIDNLLVHCFDRINETHGINKSTRGYADSFERWEEVVIQTEISSW